MNPVAVEVCLAGVDSAVFAERGGASRVELCENLIEGGTTPSHGTISLVTEKLQIDVMVMIRPRGGDFLYSDLEFEAMRRDVVAAKELKATGVVFGMLKADGSVDRERTSELVLLARPLSCTFHRAFDMTNNPFEALEDLVECKVDRILTSGQAPTALLGVNLIRQLQEAAGNRISIMPAVGVSRDNVRHIFETTNVKEVHLGSDVYVTKRSEMVFLQTGVAMGDDRSLSEYTISSVSEKLVAEVVEAVTLKSE